MERRFVNHYVEDPNGTQAYILAGYSEKGAGVSSRKLLRRKRIKDAIMYRLDQIERDQVITHELIAGELLKIATHDPADLFDFVETPKLLPDGSQAHNDQGMPITETVPRLRAITHMTPSERAAIASITFKDGQIHKLSFHSKLTALDRLAKYRGMYIKQSFHEHHHTHDVAGRLKDARAKARRNQGQQAKVIPGEAVKTE